MEFVLNQENSNKKDMFKMKLNAMRLRLKKKREEFLNFCSNTSKLNHLEYEKEFQQVKQEQELSDSVLSIEVVFESKKKSTCRLSSLKTKASPSSRTSTPIFNKSYATSKKIKLRKCSSKKLKCYKKNICNYYASPSILNRQTKSPSLNMDYLTSPYLTSSCATPCEFQDFGDFKIWYV